MIAKYVNNHRRPLKLVATIYGFDTVICAALVALFGMRAYPTTSSVVLVVLVPKVVHELLEVLYPLSPLTDKVHTAR